MTDHPQRFALPAEVAFVLACLAIGSIGAWVGAALELAIDGQARLIQPFPACDIPAWWNAIASVAINVTFACACCWLPRWQTRAGDPAAPRQVRRVVCWVGVVATAGMFALRIDLLRGGAAFAEMVSEPPERSLIIARAAAAGFTALLSGLLPFAVAVRVALARFPVAGAAPTPAERATAS